MSTTLIWPKEKLARIGSSTVTVTATRVAASNHRRAQPGPGSAVLFCAVFCATFCATPRRVSTIQTDTTSSTSVIAVITTPATGSDIHASGLKTMAASGG